MRELRVGIVGSRRRCSLKDRKIVFDIVKKLKDLRDVDVTVVSGACRLGADNFAAEAARFYGVKLVEFPVPKKQYTHRGEFAMEAFARNRLIAENSDYGFALVHSSRTGGTVSHYNDLKKKVFLVDDDGLTYLSTDEEHSVESKEDTDKT